jgi:phytoene synthase
MHVNIDDYCQEKAAPAGSSAYYALRRAPRHKQPLLTALYALYRELEESVRQVSDPTVGRTKLAWWQSEIAALANGAPHHPVTRAIAQHRGDTPMSGPPDSAPRPATIAVAPAVDDNALFTWASGFQMDLEQARYLDFAGLRRYIDPVGGAFATAIARVTARDPARAAGWAAPLGCALLLAELAERIGDDARHGRIYVPLDEMQRFGVTAADLINRRYSDAFAALMRFQVARAREQLTRALAAIPHDERRAQPTLRAQAAMALALLDEIEADQFAVLHQRIALTPLRKLWISWRAVHAR